jgi:predicted nucleic acid-binding protein
MQSALWTAGSMVTGPAYLDANILVGAHVNTQPLYVSSATVVGDLLASGQPLLVSPLAFSEAQWAMIKISFYELQGQRPRGYFTKDLFRKWHSQIFGRFGPRLQAIGVWFKGLMQAGYPIDVVPKDANDWSIVLDLSYTYVDQYRLTPADAFHLALAETYARTMVTADSDFTRMTSLPRGNLLILTVPP